MKEYFIVFTDSRQWIRRFLRPGFGHVYILQRDDYNWFVLSPERLCLRVEIAPVPSDQDLIAQWCQPHESVIKLEFGPRDTIKRFGWAGLFSCVTVARYCMGLRLSALTPFSLYKKLLTLTNQQMELLGIESIRLIKQGMSSCQTQGRP